MLASLQAQPPDGYYTPANGLTGKALQQALHDIIDNHTIISYDNLYTCFTTTDAKPGNMVWDMYSDKPGGTPAYVYYYNSGQECGNYNSEADCYNREHSFPKSWFNDASPMYSDLFHLYPTDGYVNNRRSNYPFGETSSPTWTSTNGSKVGPSSVAGYTGVIFEPINEYKGDFARTCFYMATRYYGEDASWPGSDMTDGAQPKPWALAMLLAWNKADPVSTKETDRNNAVYAYQHNRNPFIDDPQFAEKIWGSLNPVDEYTSEERLVTIYPNPAGDAVTVRFERPDCEGSTIHIYDMTGCLVLSYVAEDNSNRMETGALPAGIYFMRVACHGTISTTSFVVTR